MSEVTLLTYGGGEEFGEFIVFYQDGRRQQEYFTSASFPTQDQFKALWTDGFQVDCISFGKGVWSVLYSKDEEGTPDAEKRTMRDQQVTQFHDDNPLKSLGDHLASQWSSGRMVHQIVCGGPFWAVITYAPGKDNATKQDLLTSSAFPERDIAQRWEAGLFIRSSAFGNDTYAFLFEAGD